MKLVKNAGLVGALLCLAATPGCDSGPKYVPVSGIVTVDGKPYGEAVVVFNPKAVQGNQSPGRGSSSFTDSNGKFQLKTMDGDEGAVPGPHMVQVMTKGDVQPIDPEKGSSDTLPAGAKRRVDPIPRDWLSPGKDFTVPSEGTDKANFDIVTKK